MKTNRYLPVVVLILLLTGIIACQKQINYDLRLTNNGTNITDTTKTKDTTHTTVPSTDTTKKDTATQVVTFPQTPSTHCTGAPSYGDSIIFAQPSTILNNYIVKPINHPDSGTYFAWPQGMVLDRNTGAINVTKSETGLRYSLGWVKKGTTDTCLQTIILAGISYEDSLYVLNDAQRYAAPYYNADPFMAPVCTGSSGCAFDVTGQAALQFIIMNNATGVIDLQATANKAFGLVPLNGTTVQTNISYRLNDASNMALQQIKVTLIYYNKKSDVPPDLLAVISDRLNKVLNQVLLINLPTAASQQSISNNPRPPIIIVTRSAQ